MASHPAIVELWTGLVGLDGLDGSDRNGFGWYFKKSNPARQSRMHIHFAAQHSTAHISMESCSKAYCNT